MNKKGQLTILVMFMVGFLFFLMGLYLAPAMNETINEQMNDVQLNCSTTTDAQTKAVCTSMDLQKLYIGLIFGLAGVVLSGVIIQ